MVGLGGCKVLCIPLVSWVMVSGGRSKPKSREVTWSLRDVPWWKQLLLGDVQADAESDTSLLAGVVLMRETGFLMWSGVCRIPFWRAVQGSRTINSITVFMWDWNSVTSLLSLQASYLNKIGPTCLYPFLNKEWDKTNKLSQFSWVCEKCCIILATKKQDT